MASSLALLMQPHETSWRYELAVALQRAGRFAEAQEQARVCVRMEPDNAQYAALLREVVRAQLTPRRRSDAET